jgi:hypothetical protein
MKIKIIAPLMAYATVAIGIFWLQSAWMTLLGFHVAIISSLFIAKPNIPFSSLLKTHDKKWIALSILLSGCSGIGLFFLWPWFGIAEDLPAQLESMGLTASTWPPFIAYFTLVNPMIEEYFWRGYFGSTIQGVYIYDAIYAGYHALILIGKVHFASILFAFVMLGLAAWFWRQVTYKDGGLLAAVLGHMGADLSILLVVFWMCSRP